MPPLDNNNPRNQNSCLSRFHPVHQRLIDQLISVEVGLFNKKYKVRRRQSCGHNYPRMEREKHFDLFLLSVPVCGEETLEWQVILNEYEPHMRPDFKVFHPGFSQFLARNMVRTGLFHYDADCKDALLILVERLKKMYYEFVISSLNHSSNVYHNISSTIDMLGPAVPYELSHSHGSVDIAYPLLLDLSSVQLTLSPEDCRVVLTLTSPYPHEADIDYNTRLRASPELREQLSLDRFKLTKFNRERPMLQFIHLLTVRLQGHIAEVALAQAARKRYLLACVALCRSSVVHWDAINFSAGTLLLSSVHRDASYSFLVRLRLSDHVSVEIVSIYTGVVLEKMKTSLNSDPRDLLERIATESENERRVAQAVRGLVERLK